MKNIWIFFLFVILASSVVLADSQYVKRSGFLTGNQVSGIATCTFDSTPETIATADSSPTSCIVPISTNQWNDVNYAATTLQSIYFPVAKTTLLVDGVAQAYTGWLYVDKAQFNVAGIVTTYENEWLYAYALTFDDMSNSWFSAEKITSFLSPDTDSGCAIVSGSQICSINNAILQVGQTTTVTGYITAAKSQARYVLYDKQTVSSSTAITIGNADVSADPVIRSNPEREGSASTLDDTDDLSYVDFLFPVTVTKDTTISQINVNTNQFSYDSFDDEINASAIVKLPSLPLLVKSGTTQVKVSVLVPSNLDAIDASFNQMKYAVDVVFNTQNGTIASKGFFTVENNLELEDVEIQTDDDTFSCDVEDSQDLDCDDELEELHPTNTFTLRAELSNTFDEDDNLDLEDIDVNVDVDGDSVLDADDDNFEETVNADDSTIVEIEFDVDEDVEDGDADTVTLTAVVEDDNGARHGFKKTFDVEFELPDYDIIVEQPSLSPSSICPAEDLTLTINVLNVGQQEQKNVLITVVSPKLSINQAIPGFVLSENGEKGDDASKTLTLKTKASQAPGTYPVDITVTYRDEDSTSAKETLTTNIVVQDCGQTSETVTPNAPTNPSTNNGQIVVIPSANATQVTPTIEAVSSQSTFSTKDYLLVGIGIILVVGIFALLGMLFRK